jgi:outer membrane biosynthesis protein TonB
MSYPEAVKSLHFQYKTAFEIAIELGVSEDDAVKGVLAYKEKKDLLAKKKPTDEVPKEVKKVAKKAKDVVKDEVKEVVKEVVKDAVKDVVKEDVKSKKKAEPKSTKKPKKKEEEESPVPVKELELEA